MQKVIDTYSFLTYLEKDKGSDVICSAFEEAFVSKKKILITVIHWGEIYYFCAQKYGKSRAARIMKKISMLPIKLIKVDQPLAQESAQLRVKYHLSPSVCLAAALTKIYKAQLFTGDVEFKILEKLIRIQWIT